MKTNLLIAVVLLASSVTKGQTKKEILLEINNFKEKTILNASFDVPKQTIWDAVYIMMKQEYTEIKKQDFDKGIIEGYAEAENFKEGFISEIVGNGPYRVVFSMKRQIRYISNNGVYSGWYDRNEISNEYLYKIQKTIYEGVHGSLEIPDNLQKKVDEYNAKQKKDKNKILLGRDY